MLITNQTGTDYWFGPLHLPAGVGQQITVDDTSATSLYLTSDSVADAINNLYNAGKITVSSAASPFPRPTGVPSLLHGDGSPEGIVFAPQGSFYMRRDGAGGAFLYAKTTGITFDTGWQVYTFQATPIQVLDLANWPPASPTDGQQAVLRLPSSYDPVGGKKICWLFCYDSAAGQWNFVGGAPLLNQNPAGDNGTQSTSWVDIQVSAGSNPSLTLPRAGDYLIQGKMAVNYATYYASVTGSIGLYVNGSPGSGGVVLESGLYMPHSSTVQATWYNPYYRVAGAPAGAVIKWQYEVTSGSQKFYLSSPVITALPLRIS